MIFNICKILRALITRKIKFEIDLIPFEFEGLPLKKIINWILTEGSVFFKPTRPWGFPTILQVEVTSHCNLRCRVCPVTTGMDRLSGDMDWGLFKKTIDELKDYLLLILFWDWGEPFLNPNAYEMIRYARSRGIKVMSTTNGHVFASGDHAQNVVKSGLDVLVFSVDGVTQETYQRYRAAGRLETVFEGIRKVMAAKKFLESKTPLVNFRFIVMKHNEEEIPQLMDLGRSLGVDALTLRKFYAIPNRQQGRVEQKSEFIPSQARYQLPEYSPEDLRPMRITKNPCKNLWNCPTIHWDGTVCSCFMDFNEERPLGVLRRQSFKEIWYGQTFRDLRRNFRECWQELPLCEECSSGFKGGDVGRESNADIELFFQAKSR
jgi:MoaA/NifB/PqqE/SkfB family radical SAM enzyme